MSGNHLPIKTNLHFIVSEEIHRKDGVVWKPLQGAHRDKRCL